MEIYLRSVLTVISDESLLNRIKLILTDKTISYFYADSADEASRIASDNEIAVAFIDYNNPIVSGSEMCELLLAFNPDIQFIMLFDEADTRDVITLYNGYHINKLMCREFLVLEDLPSLIDSCLHTYNRDEEIKSMSEELKKLNEKYLIPMQDMSALLNERLSGYDNVIKVFRTSVGFVLNSSEIALKSIDTFVDRLINDYVQIFMVKEPTIEQYFSRIHSSFNKPDEKKFFKFISDNVSIADRLKYNLLFVLDAITIYFDVFYPCYRGKVSVENVNTEDVQINAIYEVRKDSKFDYEYIIKALNNILTAYSNDLKYAMKENIIQFKAVVNNNVKKEES